MTGSAYGSHDLDQRRHETYWLRRTAWGSGRVPGPSDVQMVQGFTIPSSV